MSSVYQASRVITSKKALCPFVHTLLSQISFICIQFAYVTLIRYTKTLPLGGLRSLQRSVLLLYIIYTSTNHITAIVTFPYYSLSNVFSFKKKILVAAVIKTHAVFFYTKRPEQKKRIPLLQ